MKFVKINYSLKTGGNFTFCIVADNRESAVKYLKQRQGGIQSINSIFMGDVIHAIDNNIIDNLLNSTKKVKKLKEDIQYLKNCLVESDEIIEKLRDQPIQQQETNVNEISMLHEKIVELETEKLELEQQLSGTVKENKKFKCSSCDKDFDTEKALKIHEGRMHKNE